jgi:hypothetical protein
MSVDITCYDGNIHTSEEYRVTSTGKRTYVPLRTVTTCDKRADIEDYFVANNVAVYFIVLELSDCYTTGGKIANFHIDEETT